MSTSGLYTSGSPKSNKLIDDAYERIGSNTITGYDIASAQVTANLILQEWPNKGNNLWTIRQGLIGLNTSQTVYYLPQALTDIETATIRTSTRNLGGTPFSSAGGNASNAFDANTSTACTQTAPDGYISYGWGGNSQYSISMVGIQSNETINYTLVCEYSSDNSTWTTALSIPVQSYPFGAIQWFVVPVPIASSYFRVRETGGAILNIQELYFNSNLYDTTMSEISSSEYAAIPNKNSPGKPSQFWVDRQINPVLYIYPSPTYRDNCMYFTYWKAIQDIGSLINNPEIPARFLEAFTSELAFRLGMKKPGFPLDKLMLLRELAKEAYAVAGHEDRQRVPLRLFGDYLQGWGSV
jgi:hypothetical protein